jgi:cobalt/nickel transport system permease protein
MKHDFFDHHSHGASLIHKLDARIKIVVFCLLASYALFSEQLLSQRTLFLFLGLILLLLLTRVSPLHIVGKYLRLIWIVILMTFLLPFQPSKDVVISFYGFKIYQSGLVLQLTILTRSSILLLGLVFLNLSTPFNRLLSALRWFRIPVSFINLLTYVYRFLFIFIDEMERLFICWQSRYIVLSLKKRFYYLANLIGALFIRAIERSENIYIAMKSRGYSGKIFVTEVQTIRSVDVLFLLIFISLFTIMVCI